MPIIARFARNSFFMIVLLCYSICSCKKDIAHTDDPNPDIPEQGTPLKTLPGEPLGIAERLQIGINGGTFSAADGSISITIPDGALAVATEFSIQRISNTNTAGIGTAWRILPHQDFLKPVELHIKYNKEDIVNTVPEALGMAFQDNEGVWQGTGGNIDTMQNSITISTTHFSDWSLFKAFEIIPATGVVEPGKMINLTVSNHMLADDLEVPVPGVVKPLSVQRSMAASYIKQWQLNGSGKLRPLGIEAEYTAPAAIPATNPVAINVMLKGPGAKQYMLVCNIYIGKPGIHFRINNGAWMDAITPMDAIAVDGNMILNGGVTSGNQPLGTVWLVFKDNYRLDFISWGETMPYFMYAPGDNVVYRQILIDKNGVHVSAGGISFSRYSTTPGEYIVGTFYLDRAGKQITGQTTISVPVKIDGFFMVKRAG